MSKRISVSRNEKVSEILRQVFSIGHVGEEYTGYKYGQIYIYLLGLDIVINLGKETWSDEDCC